MKFGSLFSGIGGFDLAFDRAGMECAWQVERDRDCIRVLEARYPNVKRFTDVTKVETEALEPVDLICFGWPCQDLSVAGLRAGISGKRSGLFHEAIRIVAALRPRWFVAENVPGLHSSFTPVDAPPSDVETGARWEVEEDSDFSLVLSALDELGYCVAGRVLDAQYLGVAQRRERVFLVGSLGTTSSLEILFESESVSGDSPPSREARARIASAVTTGTGKSSGPRNGNGDPLNLLVGKDGKECLTGEISCPLKGGDKRDESHQTYIPDIAWALQERDAKGSDSDTKDGHLIVAATLNSGGNSGGFRSEPGEHLVAFSSKDSGADAGPISPTLRAQNFKDSHMNGGGQVAIAFDTTQITSPGNYSEPKEGDPCHPLAKGAHAPAVVFGWNKSASQTMRVDENTTDALQASSTSNPAVCFESRVARNGRGAPSDVVPPLKAESGQTGKGDSAPLTASNFGVRRLTPRECERLQGFPDGENSVIIEACLDLQKNSASAETRNPKSQKHAGNADRTKSRSLARFAVHQSNQSDPSAKKPALLSVLINCEENELEIVYQGRSILYANSVGRSSGFPLPIKTESFVHLIAGISSVAERAIRTGKAVSAVSDHCSIHRENGRPLVRLSGSEITQLVSDALTASTPQNQPTKSTTSNPSQLSPLDLKLATSFCSVWAVIIGCIPVQTLTDYSCLRLQLNTKFAFTRWDAEGKEISDSARYRMLGNAVCVNVAYWIGRRMIESEGETP